LDDSSLPRRPNPRTSAQNLRLPLQHKPSTLFPAIYKNHWSYPNRTPGTPATVPRLPKCCYHWTDCIVVKKTNIHTSITSWGDPRPSTRENIEVEPAADRNGWIRNLQGNTVVYPFDVLHIELARLVALLYAQSLMIRLILVFFEGLAL